LKGPACNDDVRPADVETSNERKKELRLLGTQWPNRITLG
jgi:hypothetical protein